MFKTARHFYLSLSLFFISCCLELPGTTDYSIVFVHLGNQLPAYAEVALSQARTFNQDCQIILLANERALQNFSTKNTHDNITCISCESLVCTEEHDRFNRNRGSEWFFWRYTSERFLYLNDLLEQYKLKNVFHLEYDNMIYVNLDELLPIFSNQYHGIGAVFDNDRRCIPGFVFIPNEIAMKQLAKCFADHAGEMRNDMEILAMYKNDYGYDAIDHLPIVCPDYVDDHELTSPSGHTVANKYKYCQNFQLFNSIFDGAALGQYLGGIDPNNGPSQPGFINESCVVNPSWLRYEWIINEAGRKVPYVIYNEKKYRINNLHIHSKRLHLFSSIVQTLKESRCRHNAQGLIGFLKAFY